MGGGQRKRLDRQRVRQREKKIKYKELLFFKGQILVALMTSSRRDKGCISLSSPKGGRVFIRRKNVQPSSLILNLLSSSLTFLFEICLLILKNFLRGVEGEGWGGVEEGPSLKIF